MARFFAICAKASEILFHVAVVWILIRIDVNIFNHIADLIQSLFNFRETLVTGHSIRTRLF